MHALLPNTRPARSTLAALLVLGAIVPLASADVLLDQDSIPDGTGRRVSGTDVQGGWSVYQPFDVSPCDDWHVTGVGTDGWLIQDPFGFDVSGTFYPDNGSGLGPALSTPLGSGVHWWHTNPFGSQWTNLSQDIVLERGRRYWYVLTANDFGYWGAVFHARSGLPSYSIWEADGTRFNSTPVALRIEGSIVTPTTGLFGPVATYGSFGGAVIAAGDVDGDGSTDLLTDHAVFLNNGGGAYELMSTFDAGPTVSAIALGDLDMDGDLDLAAVNRGEYSSGCGCHVNSFLLVLRNSGSGEFGDPMLYTVGARPESLALGDLDGNELLDVVVANNESNIFSVLMNNGDGTLAGQVVYATPPGPWGIALADMDEDEDLDAVVSSDLYGGVSVYRNVGPGIFSPLGTYNGPPLPRSIALDDIDGDERPDVVVLHPDFDLVSLMINTGGGELAYAGEIETRSNPADIALGDVDGDADPDLVITSVTCGTVSVFENTGGVTFADRGIELTGTGPLGVVLTRLDCNASPDIALSAGDPSSGLSVHLNVFSSCPADFNGDGGVGFADLTEFLNNWGTCGPCCPWDLDRNGGIGFSDLTQLLATWGPCP